MFEVIEIKKLKGYVYPALIGEDPETIKNVLKRNNFEIKVYDGNSYNAPSEFKKLEKSDINKLKKTMRTNFIKVKVNSKPKMQIIITNDEGSLKHYTTNKEGLIQKTFKFIFENNIKTKGPKYFNTSYDKTKFISLEVETKGNKRIIRDFCYDLFSEKVNLKNSKMIFVYPENFEFKWE